MGDAAITVENLVKRFGEVEALKGISFEVERGKIFGLLGPNGAGKTTAVRILSTTLKPDAGRAEVMGYDVVRDADEVRYHIGLAGQSAAVDKNLTGMENLMLIGRLAQLPRRIIVQRAQQLLERFELTEAGNRPLRTYSGGMRRRLDVAAALVQQPPVLFLDEPTTGLDIQSRAELWDVIKDLVKIGSTVLLTTQYLEEADQLADRIAVVNEGEVVANDTAEALKNRLGSTTVELVMADDEAGRQAEEILSRLVTDHTQRSGSTVRMMLKEDPKAIIRILHSLDDNRLAPESVSIREPTLDEVFLSLTGSRPSDVEAGGRAAGKGAA